MLEVHALPPRGGGGEGWPIGGMNYKCVVVDVNAAEEKLNELSRFGWQLVSATTRPNSTFEVVLFFKK